MREDEERQDVTIGAPAADAGGDPVGEEPEPEDDGGEKDE